REDDTIRATSIGHTVSRLYLDPMSAAEIIDGLRYGDERSAEPSTTARADDERDRPAADDAEFVSARDLQANGEGSDAEEGAESEEGGDSVGDDGDTSVEPTPLGLFHLVSRTPDMYELYLKSGDKQTYTELCYEHESEFLGRVPSEYEEVAFEDWLAALKTGKLLDDWASEVDEDRITERYGVGPGDIRGKVDTAEWLLGAAEQLAGKLDLSARVAIREAKKRIEYGVREELLDLAGVRNVGRKRARRLYEAGIESRADLRDADKSVILGALRGRRKTAETILENVGRQEPSMEDTDQAETATTTVATDDGAGTSGGKTASSGGGRGETDDQSSLGDFG
ncbi:MAG: hypothetical protein J07HN6_00373, partial [Halonotius sp. J07HN6]